MAKQTKSKFPVDREKQSEAFKNGLVSVNIYSTDPGINIVIKGDYSEAVHTDLHNAVDDVLKFHEAKDLK
jgi:hypothetical protein